MSSHFSSNDTDVVILREEDGVIDTTRRPVSDETRKRIQKQLEKEAELRQSMQQIGKKEAEAMRGKLKKTPMSELETRFDAAMMEIYRRAKSEAKYNAAGYFQMLADHCGIETAKALMHSGIVSENYTALWERGRLDLTVEALIYEHPEFHSLFTEEEREIARKRLVEYGYLP